MSNPRRASTRSLIPLLVAAVLIEIAARHRRTGSSRPSESTGQSVASAPEIDILREPATVVSFYSRMSAAYELWGKLVDSRARRRMLSLAAVVDGAAVLEVGCGDGSLLEALARANPTGRTVGIELAEGMLARTARRLKRTNLPGVELHRGDVRQLPFEDASFDVVTCAYVLDILPLSEIAEALAEVQRVLRPGGRLVVANAARAERRRHRLPELLYGTGLPLTSLCRPIDTLARLADAGFTQRRREYSAQFLLPTEIVLARANATNVQAPA